MSHLLTTPAAEGCPSEGNIASEMVPWRGLEHVADEQGLQKLGLLILAEGDKGQLYSNLCGECG